MRRLLASLPLILGLGGCIESSVDLSASVTPAFPIAEGFYKSTNDPKSPAFKIVRSGSDYRAIDPTEANDKGSAFSLMDPDDTGLFIAEDKSGASDPKSPSYSYYFVRVSATGDRVDLYDFVEADWRRLPADLKKRIAPGVGLRLVDDAEAPAILRALDQRLAKRPTLRKTTFRLVRKIDS